MFYKSRVHLATYLLCVIVCLQMRSSAYYDVQCVSWLVKAPPTRLHYSLAFCGNILTDLRLLFLQPAEAN